MIDRNGPPTIEQLQEIAELERLIDAKLESPVDTWMDAEAAIFAARIQLDDPPPRRHHH